MARDDTVRLFLETHSERAKGSGYRLQQVAFQLDKDGRKGEGRKVFLVRVIRHRNTLPKETIESPSLETPKTCLDKALSNST